MSEVHADWGAFAQNGIRSVCGAMQEFRAEPQGLVRRMAHAEHPLIASNGADALTNLVSQRLKGEPMVGNGESRTNRVAGSFVRLNREEVIDGFFKAAVQKVLVALEGHQPALANTRLGRQMKPVNGVEKK
jgi:hypothetical protein